MSAAIQEHLHERARTLRRRPGPELRRRLLDALDAYAARGVFPRNPDGVARRRPVPVPAGFPMGPDAAPRFIDDRGVHCAVGHLMQVSGHGDLARRIARRDPWRFVHELDEPEVRTWAADHGVSVDELATIQPGYGPPPPTLPAGDLEVHVVVEDSWLEDDGGHQVLEAARRVQACVDHVGLTEPVELWIELDSRTLAGAPRLWGPPAAQEVLHCLGSLDVPLIGGVTRARVQVVPVDTPDRGRFTLRATHVRNAFGRHETNAVPTSAQVRRLQRGEPAEPGFPEYTDHQRALELFSGDLDGARVGLSTLPVTACLRGAGGPAGASIAPGTATLVLQPDPDRPVLGGTWTLEDDELTPAARACLDHLEVWTLHGTDGLRVPVRVVETARDPEPGWVRDELGIVQLPPPDPPSEGTGAD